MTIFDDSFLMTIFDDIETIFDNWKDSPGDLTFETLITILTIENLNSVNHSYLTINCDTGQHSQFLRCFVFTIPDICQFYTPLAYAKSANNLYKKAKISPNRVHRLEKSTPPPVLAVLTNISYGVHIVWLEDMSFVIQKYCAYVLIKKCMPWSWNICSSKILRWKYEVV